MEERCPVCGAPKVNPKYCVSCGYRFEGEGEVKVLNIPISRLKPLFPRLTWDEEKMKELAKSVREIGIREPLLVRPKGEIYEVVAGTRRLEAAKRAGLNGVPCLIREMDDEETYIVSLTENLQREELCDYETALRLKELKEKFSLSTRQIGGKLGKSHMWVVHHLRMLEVERMVETIVSTDPSKYANITPRDVMVKLNEGQCRAILSAPEKYREALVEQICLRVSQGIELPTMGDIEKMVEAMERAESQIEEAPKIEEEEVEAEEKEITTIKELVEAMRSAPTVTEEEVEAKTVERLREKREAEEARALRVMDKMLDFHSHRFLDLVETITEGGYRMELQPWKELVKNIENLLLDFLEERGLLDEFQRWVRKRWRT